MAAPRFLQQCASTDRGHRGVSGGTQSRPQAVCLDSLGCQHPGQAPRLYGHFRDDPPVRSSSTKCLPSSAGDATADCRPAVRWTKPAEAVAGLGLVPSHELSRAVGVLRFDSLKQGPDEAGPRPLGSSGRHRRGDAAFLPLELRSMTDDNRLARATRLLRLMRQGRCTRVYWASSMACARRGSNATSTRPVNASGMGAGWSTIHSRPSTSTQ